MKIIFIILLFWFGTGFSLNDPFVKATAAHFIQAYIPVHYADAGNLSQSLNNRQLDLLSPSGKVFADTRSNQLYVKDDRAHFQKIRQYIQQMDVPLPQVLISAKIISVDNNYLHDLGAIFKTDAVAKNTPINFVAPEANTLHFPILSFSKSYLLNLQIHALEEEGHASVLSKPEIITLNREAASIESGDEIPYQESTSSGATSVTFKKAVLKLKVTPTILPKKSLLLNVQINQDKVGSLSVNGVPTIRTEQLNTAAMMRSGETIILGGIFETSRSKSIRGIPILNKIPILGQVFSQKRLHFERKELLIFITPKILFPETPW